MKRTFIAFKVPLPVAFEQFYSKLQQYFSEEPVQWVPRENLHITLNFLGATQVHAEEQVRGLLLEVIPQFNLFAVQLQGLGAFPSASRPKVLWYGLQADQQLILLQQTLHTGLLKLGFKLDERKFNPHLTIGRVKGPLHVSFRAIQEEARSLVSGEMHIREIVFFESILKGKTPVYRPVQVFLLGDQ